MILPGRPLSASICLTLLALAGSAGCIDSEKIGWFGITAAIRDEYPDVEHITPAQLASWLEEAPPPILLDVREPEEFAVSHINGANLATDVKMALEILRETPAGRRIVAYCSVGYRSAALVRSLQSNGYSAARNLDGSIFRWANEGRPVYRGPNEVKMVHPYDDKWGRLLDPPYRWHGEIEGKTPRKEPQRAN